VSTPQIPKAFASLADSLGAPKRYFPVRSLNRAGSLVVFIIFLCFSILVFLYGLYVTYLAFLKHGPALIDDTLTLPVIGALALLLPGLAAGRSAYVNWNKGVLIYERGLAIRERKGIHAWRWEEIVSLTESVTRHFTIRGNHTGTTHRYRLINRQNQLLVLNDMYTGVEEMAKTIQERIFPILYERAARQFNAGQGLDFGPVAMSNAGIQIGKKTVPWAEVQQVSIQQGILKVSKKSGGWFSGASASASVIPNLNVLLNIISQVIGLKTG
jgi:hypothetical protein